MSTTNNTTEAQVFRKLERKQHSKAYKLVNNAMKSPYVLAAPAMITGLFISVFAIVFCIIISFYNWNLVANTREFVGIANYQYIFHDDVFLKALRNTLVFVLFSVFFGVALKVLVALFLNKNTLLHNTVQTIMFTPHIIASVAVAVVFRYMMRPDGGIFNQILTALHLPTSQWYMSEKTALGSLVLIAIWSSLGYGVLVCISGLRSIPNYVYEAARLDKASKTNTLFRITVPLLSPTIFYLLITTSVTAFTTYDVVDLMTQGGPNNATNMLTYYIYEEGIHFMHYGRAMAASVILMLIVGGLTAANFALSANKIHYQ